MKYDGIEVSKVRNRREIKVIMKDYEGLEVEVSIACCGLISINGLNCSVKMDQPTSTLVFVETKA